MIGVKINMGMYRIGDVIKKARESKGITQERLSEGICSVPTLSRIENNERMPSRSVFNRLMQRLGRNPEIYDSFLNKSEFNYFLKKREIQRQFFEGEQEEVKKLINDLEMLLEEIDNSNQQFYKFIKLLFNEDKYSNYELLKKYYEILELTIPNFDENKITDYLLDIDEELIINAIACKYSIIGDYQRAIKIEKRLVNYLEEKFISDEDRERIYPMVVYNLSKWQGIQKQYELAINTCDKGIVFCNKVKTLVNYGELLYNKGYNYIQLGDKSKGLDNMKIAYYIFLAQHRYVYADHTKTKVQEMLNILI